MSSTDPIEVSTFNLIWIKQDEFVNAQVCELLSDNGSCPTKPYDSDDEALNSSLPFASKGANLTIKRGGMLVPERPRTKVANTIFAERNNRNIIRSAKNSGSRTSLAYHQGGMFYVGDALMQKSRKQSFPFIVNV